MDEHERLWHRFTWIADNLPRAELHRLKWYCEAHVFLIRHLKPGPWHDAADLLARRVVYSPLGKFFASLAG